jgi:hypothetical protein
MVDELRVGFPSLLHLRMTVAWPLVLGCPAFNVGAQRPSPEHVGLKLAEGCVARYEGYRFNMRLCSEHAVEGLFWRSCKGAGNQRVTAPASYLAAKGSSVSRLQWAGQARSVHTSARSR